MPVKQYDVPNMPGSEEAAEAHAGFHSFLDKLRSFAGVRDVEVDHANKQVRVHMDEGDDYLPNIDQALYEFGQLPGFTGQA